MRTRNDNGREGYSLSGDSRRRNLSGHRKKPTDRGTLTSWGRQREVLVRTREEAGQPRHTHKLETAGGTWSGHRKKPTDRGTRTSWGRQRGVTCQDTEENWLTEAHSQTGDGRGRNLVMTQEETDRQRRTHSLETAEGRACQDTERNRPTEAHSLPGDGRRWDLSGHGKKRTDRGALTSWRRQEVGLVRTRKETNRPRHTHILETAEEETCQDTERNGPTEAHLQTGDGRGRDLSGHRKKRTN